MSAEPAILNKLDKIIELLRSIDGKMPMPMPFTPYQPPTPVVPVINPRYRITC